MGDTTVRSAALRKTRGDFDKYLFGNGIDIGAGWQYSLVVEKGTVRPWDQPDGDAQFMLGIENESFDFVYSAHCLEHLVDVSVSLENWVRILKIGGYLYITVPDYALYEHYSWPSRFNTEHKFSFSLDITKEHVGRQNHFHIWDDLVPILNNLGIEIISCELEDDGYDYNDTTTDQTEHSKALAQICIIGKKTGNFVHNV